MPENELPSHVFQVATLDQRHVLICPKHKTLATLIMTDYRLEEEPKVPYERIELTPMLKGFMMVGFGCMECQHPGRDTNELVKELLWIILPRGEPIGDFMNDIGTCYSTMNRESEMMGT